jgi:hypothetical protein
VEKIEVYHHKNIINIGNLGLEFVNSSGENHFIDFNECKVNWIEYVNTSGQFSGGTSFKVEESVCVGWRDICSKPSYIEFFTKPRLRFIFPYKRTLVEKLFNTYSKKEYREFSKLQQQIIENGWSTFDLS